MTDSPILTPEEVRNQLGEGWNGASERRLLRHDAALRAALAAAEERAEQVERECARVQERWQEAQDDLTMSEARAVAAEAERDQAIRERDYQYKLRSAMTDRALTAEAKIHTLRDELAWVRDELRQPKYSGCGHITYHIDAALGENNNA